MALPTYDEYLAEHQKRKADQDSYFQSIGYVKVGNKYVRDPNYQNPADQLGQSLDLQSKALNIQKSQKDLAGGVDNELSVADAAALGVPYGTTKSQAKNQNITPKKATTDKPTEQQVAFSSLKALIPQIKFSNNGNLQGVGALGGGKLGSLLYGLGIRNKGDASDQGETNRIAISQIQATVAKLRGGTSFTPNEEKLLRAYTPNINDSPARVKAKLNGLGSYVDHLDKQYNFTTKSSGGGQAKADPLGVR